ncbi:MAG: RNB domain-containing ribonuclease, partial [Hyphococcus sp.]
YAHFTSPIRRYADLTVHRALIKAFKLGAHGQTAKEAGALPVIAQTISDLERRAIAAERESNDRYLAGYLEDRIGADFKARIRGVTKFGLFVMLDESGADGFIPMRSIGYERFRFEERNHRVVGETTGGVYRLGQAVEVRLVEAAPLTGGLRFEMISEPLAGDARPARQKTSPRTKRGSKKKSAARKKPAKTAKKKRRKANAKPRRP